MKWLNRKRNTLEKLSNERIKVTVGTKGLNEVTLALREPYIPEVTRFIENAISDCTETYVKSLEQLEGIVAKGNIGVKDIRLLTPMIKPICGLIATMGDRKDLEETLFERVTVSQFAECFNATLHLLDLEKIIPNFTGALGKVTKVMEKMKKS